MSRARQVLKRKRGSKAIPVLGAAGLSLTLASGASAATVGDMLTHTSAVGHEITLTEEEVADVSLATFYVFDKEAIGASRSRLKLAGMGGCGGCAGCGGVGWACAWTGTYYTPPVFGGDGDTPLVRPRHYAPRHVQKKY
jgi:hypothetical protein